MPEEKLFLAADSGGSKTDWFLINESGTLISNLKTIGLASLKEGMLPVCEAVAEAFEYFRPYGKISSLYLSLGGPNVAEVESALKTVWNNCSVKVEREANGTAILAAARMVGCSAVLMCGTGSTAMGDTKCGRRYCGGWGPIYGDGGSGGGMGADALRLYLRHIDGLEKIGKLSQVFDYLTEGLRLENFNDRMELKARALNINRRELAATAPKIYDLFADGDKTAAKLYGNAADEIARMAYSVSDNSKENKILLCGGFFANKPKFIEECRRRFAQISDAKLQYIEQFSPIVAAQMAVLNSSTVITEDLFQRLLKNKGG